MPSLAIELDNTAATPRIALGSETRKGPLKCVLMDDSRFDRRYLRSVAAQSRFDLDFVETSSIAETRAVIEEGSVDMVLLDYRVPDGDGIEFARQISRDPKYAGLPIIVVTGEGSERAAIQALRSGAADYLQKDDITKEIFDQAIENALTRASGGHSEQTQRLSELLDENATLRRSAVANMRLLKGQTLPLLSFAWQSVFGSPPEEAERPTTARRLEKITRKMTELIDDTVIVAATHRAGLETEVVDLVDLIAEIRAQDAGEIRSSGAKISVSDLPCLTAVKSHLLMMFEELILTAVRSGRLGSVPEIAIGAGADPDGNPIIVFAENGLHLSARRQTMAKNNAGLDPSVHMPRHDAHAWSLCQRLAERCGGMLRVSELPEGGVRVMIRFPKTTVA